MRGREGERERGREKERKKYKLRGRIKSERKVCKSKSGQSPSFQ